MARPSSTPPSTTSSCVSTRPRRRDPPPHLSTAPRVGPGPHRSRRGIRQLAPRDANDLFYLLIFLVPALQVSIFAGFVPHGLDRHAGRRAEAGRCASRGSPC